MSTSVKNKRTDLLLINAIAGLFFISLNGGVRLFDWDEINFAECAREMIVMNDYLRAHIDLLPFWEKPPLVFWLQALAMKIFGINEFSARFPNAVCGMLTLSSIYLFGSHIWNRKFAWLWVGSWFGAVLPHLYFKSGIIDPWFNLFMFLSIMGLIMASWSNPKKDSPFANRPYRYLFLGGIALGLAMLTKGPTGLLVVGLTAFTVLIVNRFQWYLHFGQFLFFGLVALATAAIWFGVETYLHGPWFVTTFITYNYRLFSTGDAGHSGFPGYHFVVLLVGCFPASIFAIRGMGLGKRGNAYQADFHRWMLVLFWVVLILFSVVGTKIVHYSSMCYFPLTFLSAITINQLWEKRIEFSTWMRGLIVGIGALFALVVIALPFLAMQKTFLRQLLEKDPFAVANLEAEIHWTGWEILPGIVLIAVLVLFFYYYKKQNNQKAFSILSFGIGVFVLSTLIAFIGRIEGFSQAAAMEFYESKQNERCYILTKDFRTFGTYFYGKVMPPRDTASYNENWLLTGPVDRPTYIVTKITGEDQVKDLPTVRKLYSKNGFVFFVRVR